MPKQTFYNLPIEKKETILYEALIEFGHNGFDMASIQNIVEQSNISRGSFYQYFEDKADLFGEVLMEISASKMKFLEPVLNNENEYGLFELIEKLVEQGVEFGMEKPLAVQIVKDIPASKTLDMEKFMKDMKDKIYERNQITPEGLYLKAIENSIKRGEISKQYPTETILAYVQGMVDVMGELYWQQMTGKSNHMDMAKVIPDMISILRNGLSSTNKTN